MPHILIVDDERDLADLVDFNLKQAGYETTITLSGAEAISMAKRKVPDLVLLDLMLPDVSGREVCRQLKADPRTRDIPVVMLTARGEEHERVEGFEVGADDYVTKPFSPRELLLRVKAILRRAPGGRPEEERVVVGPLVLDTSAHRVTINGNEVVMTALEFRLLLHLAQRPGRVQSREQLLADVWGINSALETRTVDTHVMRLRDKLAEARELVETVRGVGYRLVDPKRE